MFILRRTRKDVEFAVVLVYAWLSPSHVWEIISLGLKLDTVFENKIQ